MVSLQIILLGEVMSVRANLRDRMEATKTLVDFSVTKEVWVDLKGRFGRDVRPTTIPAKYGLPGTIGGVAGTLLTIPVALVDKAEKWWQEQARITRRWVK